VIGEIDPSLASLFSRATIGATAQGWLRRTDESGLLLHGHVESLCPSRFGGRVTLLTVSEQDLAGAPVPPSWLDAFPLIIVTAARHGLRLWQDGRWWRMPAFPAHEVDPTGAGDALTAAFLVRYAETGETGEAARFAAAAASLMVEQPGLEGAADRGAIARRRLASPKIQLTPA
jgi:pfkB family carbohydrate kinase